MTVRVKICGITSEEDAFTAVEAGADALGFVFFSQSPRCITPGAAAKIISAVPPYVQTVGLFVNEEPEMVNGVAEEAGVDVIQLHGDEPPEYGGALRRRWYKALRIRGMESLDDIRRYALRTFLLDAYSPSAYGGTGKTFNWEIAAAAAEMGRVILAGGLTADNVAAAVRAVAPFAVDVSSGVEKSPGVKDPVLVRHFIARAKGAALPPLEE